MKNLSPSEVTTQQSMFKKLVASLVSASLIMPFALPAYAAEPAQAPLVVTAGSMADPNVMLVFDMSGSMNHTATPDTILTSMNFAVEAYAGIHPEDVTMYNFFGAHTTGANARRNIYTISTDKTDPMSVLYRSPQINKSYYDPAVTYTPWKNAAGELMKIYDPKAAPIYASPVNQARYATSDHPNGPTVDLTIQQYDFTHVSTKSTFPMYCRGSGSYSACLSSGVKSFTPAIYFIYKGSEAYPDAPAGTYYPDAVPDPEFMYDNSSASIKTPANYVEVIITSDAVKNNGVQQRGTRSDCTSVNAGPHDPDAVITCTQKEELQNFTNWYVYYRDRKRVAVGALTHVLNEDYGMNYRLGWAHFTQPNYGWGYNFFIPSLNIDGSSSSYSYVRRGVRDFTDSATKASIFASLYLAEHGTEGGTPTRTALNEIGRYFSETSTAGPWGNTPGTASPAGVAQQSCRRSYAILLTDGGYNDSYAVGEMDNNSLWPEIVHANGTKKYRYTPSAPFKDSYANTLADVAFKYWVQDLQPSLPNDIPAREDSKMGQGAFWQNMMTHTVGFGIKGGLKKSDEDSLLAGLTAWPSPDSGWASGTVSTALGRSDDLWHAAVNGHGKYFSANTVAPLIQAFREIFDSMVGDSIAPPKTAILSNQMVADNTLFSTTYRAGDWSGDLFSYKASLVGNAGTQNWSAAAQMPAESSRNIWIGSGKTNPASSAPAAVEFKWSSVSGNASLAAALESEELLNYIRGDKTGEDSGIYRKRPRATTGLSPLGDIVNSTPVIAHKAQGVDISGYEYSVYLAAMKDRTPMVFVGANDGMLHAFNMNTGEETFAFIPNGVAPKLKHLASESYNGNHKYYADGPLALVDVYLDNLVLECYKEDTRCHRNILLGSAGAGARSVFALDVTNPNKYTGADASNPVLWELTPESDGMKDLGFVMQEMQYYKRTVDYGTNAELALFGNGAYGASGKAVLYAIDMRSGKQVASIEVAGGGSDNGLMGVTVVGNSAYAGDLKGNLWYFDLSAKDPRAWTAKKIFTTTGNRPITQRPAYLAHPLGGYTVLFGTGKFYDNDDGMSTDTEAVYGIWDKDHKTIGYGQLITYKIKKEGAFYTYETLPVIDWDKNRGWTLPLTMGTGQRSLYTPVMIGSNVGFTTTLIKGGASGSSCEAGSLGGITLFMDARSGGFSSIKWDTNGDGIIDGKDGNYIGFPSDGGEAGHLLYDPGLASGGGQSGAIECPPGYALTAKSGMPLCVKPRDTKTLIQLF